MRKLLLTALLLLLAGVLTLGVQAVDDTGVAGPAGSEQEDTTVGTGGLNTTHNATPSATTEATPDATSDAISEATANTTNDTKTGAAGGAADGAADGAAGGAADGAVGGAPPDSPLAGGPWRNGTPPGNATNASQLGSIGERLALTKADREPIVFGEPVQWTTRAGTTTTPPIHVTTVPSETEDAWTRDLFFTTAYNGTYRNVTYTTVVPTTAGVTLSHPWPFMLDGSELTFTIPELHGHLFVRLTGAFSTEGAVIRNFLELPGLAEPPLLYREGATGRVYLNNDSAANVTFEQDADGSYVRVLWNQDLTTNATYGYEPVQPPPSDLYSYLPLPGLAEPPLFYRDNGTDRILINDVERFDVQFHTDEDGLYTKVTWLHDGADVTYYLETPTAPRPTRERQLPGRIDAPIRWQRELVDAAVVPLPQGVDGVTLRHTVSGKEETQYYTRDEKTGKELVLPFRGNYTLTYTTPPPIVTETRPQQHRKRITISSPYHYTNLTATASIPETPRAGASLYWLRDGKRQRMPATFTDTNGNGRVDHVEWVVPHLSNQTFEIDLTVLTIQSYPTVGGQWTVEFETVGQANLTIEPWNGTDWTDIAFDELRCGDEVVTTTLTDGAVRVPAYECNTTSTHVVTVLTKGKHTQLLTFGNETGTARNLAGRAPAVILLSDAAGDANQTTDQPIYWDTEERVDANAFAHSSDTNNSIEVLQDGVYRVVYGVHVIADAEDNRYQALTHVEVDGADSNACYASGYSRGNSNTNQLVPVGECLLELTAGQNVSVVIRRVSSVSTLAPTIQGATSWFQMQLVDTPSVLILQDNDGSQEYDTANITIDYDTTLRNDTAFNTSLASGTVTVNNDGLYRVSYGVGVDHSSNNRASSFAHLQLRASGTASFTDLPYGWSHANQRGQQLSREAALTASTLLNLSTNDTLRLRVGRASVLDPGNLSTVRGRIHLDVEYLGPDETADVLRAYDAAGGDDPNAGAYNQTWDTEESDGDDFTYAGDGFFTVSRTGLYHIGYGVYVVRTSGSSRILYSTELLVNEAVQEQCRGQGYNRGDQGSYDSWEGGSEAACYVELNAGDSVGIRVQRTSTSGNAIPTAPDRVWLAVQSMDYGADPPSVTGPEINDSTPINVYSTVTVNANVTDWDSGVDTVGIEASYPNGTQRNLTTNVLGSHYFNDSIALNQLGNYTFRFLANDTAGHENTTEYALTTNGTTSIEVVDRTTPLIGTREMNESGSVPLNSIVCLNATGISDNFALGEVWAEYTNTNGLKLNLTMSNETACNGTTQADTYGVLVNVGSSTGTFTYHAAYVNDTSGNIGAATGDQTLTITFAPDTVPPTLFINYPENITYGTGDIAYDITADEQLNESLVSIDGAPNMTMTNDTLFHWYNASGDHPTLTEGVHTARFFANDSASNSDEAEVNFTVDLTPPELTNIQANETEVELGERFTLSADVTDTISPVSTVLFTLRYPGVESNLTPTDSGGGTYTYDVATTQRGNHNWSDIYATSIGGTNHTMQEVNISVYAATDIDTVLFNQTDIDRNDTITISAHLRNETGDGVSAQRLTFRVGSTTVGSGTTDASGWASYDWAIPLTQLPGTYTVNVSYAQNDTNHYRGSENTEQTMAIYAQSMMNDSFINDTYPVQGENVLIATHLRYENGTPIPNQRIAFDYQHLPDENIYHYGTNLTNATGWAHIRVNTSTFPTGLYSVNYTYLQNDTLYVRAANRDNRLGYLYPPTGHLNASIAQPSTGQRVPQDDTFTLEADVHCDATDAQICGAVNATPRYRNQSITDWYDQDWQYRIPVTVQEQDGVQLLEYQVEITLDSADLISESKLQEDCGDLRVVDDKNRSLAFDMVPDHGSNHSCGGSEMLIWAQIPELNASQSPTLYVYYGNDEAETAHDTMDTYNYTVPRTSKYVVHEELAQNDITVVSFADGNEITNGTDTLVLNKSDTATLRGSQATDFKSSKPFHADNAAGSFGISMAPASWAGTEFVTNNNRGVMEIDIISPWGDANVTLYNSPGAGWSKYESILLAQNGSTHIASIAQGEIIRVSANTSILVTRSSKTETEDYLVIPPASDRLLGIGSNTIYGACLNDGTTINWYDSTNTNGTITCDAGDAFSFGSQGQDGDAPAFHFTANRPIGAIAQADGDGTESTPFRNEVNICKGYFAAGSYEYIAIAAPQNETNCTRYDASGTKRDSLLSEGPPYPSPSRIRFGTGSAGDYIACDADVHAYYELQNSYETILLGCKDNRQFHDPPPTTTNNNEQTLYPSFTTSGTPFTVPAVTQSCGALAAGDRCELNWTVNATGAEGFWAIDALFESDASAVRANATPRRDVNITDSTPPVISLLQAPLNNSGLPNRNLTVIYNVTDYSGVQNCTFYLNNSPNKTRLAPPVNTTLNFSLAGLAVGEYTWRINCSDDSYYRNRAATGNYTVTSIPATNYTGESTDLTTVTIENITELVLDVPEAGLLNFTDDVNLSGGASLDELVTITNTTITVNSAAEPRLNKSALLTFRDLGYQFAPVLLRNGRYCGPPTCQRLSYSGGVAQFNVSHFTSYTSAKNANLTIFDETDPEGGGTPHAPDQPVRFYGNYSNWTNREPIFGPNVNCTIRFNISDAWTADANFSYNSTSELYEYDRSFALNGTYEWNAFCNGTSQGYEELNVTDNVTISTDFIVNSVVANQTSIVEGDTLTIQVNLSNRGPALGSNVTLNITTWNGSVWQNGSYYRREVNFTGIQDHLENFTWTAAIGTHHFNATIDPDDVYDEANESNNNLTSNYTVEAWEVLFGTVAQEVFIGDTGNQKLQNWTVSRFLGNIFYSDDDSSYDPANLAVFTEEDDFNDTDAALGLTGFNDSVRRLFDADNDGVADETRTFTVMGAPLADVPVINSSNSSAFVTGILWDSDDSAAYTGNEDLIFITKVNVSQKGRYGSYDYEVRLPATLGELFPGTSRITQLQEII